MSKKLFLALGAFALGIGAGIGLKALWDHKRKCCIDSAEDEVVDLVPHACVCEKEKAPAACETAPQSEEKKTSPVLFDEVTDGSEEPLEVPLGLDTEGNTVYCDLAKMPHLLLAGTTGSGKSVALGAMLTSLAEKNFPEDLRFLLIDPKMVEWNAFEKCPYLLAPILTSPRDVLASLGALVQEMENRYELFRAASVRMLRAYNEKMVDEPDRRLPFIVVAVDELFDLFAGEYGERIEQLLVCLAQKGRAAGIHLILSTQRPTTDVITPNLKCNVPSRIAFKTLCAEDARTVLDSEGAEQLRGRGDMLYLPVGEKAPLRVQGVFLSEQKMGAHLEALCAALPELTYDEAFAALTEAQHAALRAEEEKGSQKKEDPLFFEALAIAVEGKKASTSLLQRRIGIGYARAAKLIERMEELELIGPVESNKPRSVLPAAAEYLAKAQAE